ncbi:MAG: tRNA lysidine(34) synthetase TilS [Burkholderiales bacterium]
MRHADAPDDVRAAAARALAAHVPAGAAIAVALSGGRDSVVLLDALFHVAPPRGHRVAALHVHHGLSPNADRWQRFCADLCATRGVPFTARAVVVPRTPQASVEAEARRLRYAALADAAVAAGIRHVALAHHRDDQAETLLLQLLRGAGPHGLAGMPAARTDLHGVTIVRPLLDCPRAAIDAYAQAAGLAWVDDESNAAHRHLRNAVRHVVLPALVRVAPQAPATLARAARHQADAARLADDLAALDAATYGNHGSLECAALAALPPHRARNLLRWFVRQHGLPAPSEARLAAMMAQLAAARADANVALAHGGVELGVWRGRVVVHPASPPAFDVRWSGESELTLPHGRLAFDRADGAGLDATRIAAAPVSVRPRTGGERLQLAAGRPRRALKSLLQEAGLAPWDRRALPLVFCGDALAAAPGVGVDAAFAARPGAPGVTVVWHPKPI